MMTLRERLLAERDGLLPQADRGRWGRQGDSEKSTSTLRRARPSTDSDIKIEVWMPASCTRYC